MQTIYTSYQYYYSSLLSTHLPSFLAGWLIQTLPVGHKKCGMFSTGTPTIRHRKNTRLSPDNKDRRQLVSAMLSSDTIWPDAVI